MKNVPDLTPGIARLAAALLHRAGQAFGHHGCNDFWFDKVPGFETREARAALDLAEHTWNGDPGEHIADGDHRCATDFSLMHFCAAILDKAAGVPKMPSDEEARVIDLQSATQAVEDATATSSHAIAELTKARARALEQLGKAREAVASLEKATQMLDEHT